MFRYIYHYHKTNFLVIRLKKKNQAKFYESGVAKFILLLILISDFPVK